MRNSQEKEGGGRGKGNKLHALLVAGAIIETKTRKREERREKKQIRSDAFIVAELSSACFAPFICTFDEVSTRGVNDNARSPPCGPSHSAICKP